MCQWLKTIKTKDVVCTTTIAHETPSYILQIQNVLWWRIVSKPYSCFVLSCWPTSFLTFCMSSGVFTEPKNYRFLLVWTLLETTQHNSKLVSTIFRHFKAVMLHIIPLGKDSNVCVIAVRGSKHSLNGGLFWHFLSVRCTPLLATQKYELIQCRMGPWPWRKSAASAHLPYKEKLLERSRLWNRPALFPPRQVAHFSSGRHTHLTPLTTHTCRHTATQSDMLDGHRQILSSSPHCVYTFKDHTHTHPVLKQRKCIRITVRLTEAFEVDANFSGSCLQ